MAGILGNMFEMNQDDELTELELAGINPEELEYMDGIEIHGNM